MKKSGAAGSRKGQQAGENTFLLKVVNLFVLLILAGQMLVYHDYYFDILETKYYYFCACAMGMLILFLLYGLVMHNPVKIVMQFRASLERAKEWVKETRFRDIFSSTDVMVLLYTLIVVISTVLSPYPFEAFWGNEGRYTGAFLLLLETGVYFCVSRHYRVKSWHIQIFLLSGMAMCLFGISDYFGLDLLHFKEHIDPNQYNSFSSFIGNVNTYTACVALVMAMACILFVSSTHVVEILWYGACVLIAFLAIITGQSDNAYLSMMALFGFLPLYLFRNWRGFCRYVLLLAMFCSTMLAVAWTQVRFPEAIRLTGLFKTLIDFEKFPAVTGYLWLLVIALYLVEAALWAKKTWFPAAGAAKADAAGGKRSRSKAVGAGEDAAGGKRSRNGASGAGENVAGGKKLRTGAVEAGEDAAVGKRTRSGAASGKPAWFARAWWLVIIAAAALIAFAVYDATIAGNAERYGALQQYVLFQDSWGTTRGYAWRIAVENYMDFPLLQKIFGSGPDTFAIVAYYNNLDDMVSRYNVRFDSVHNEFLQMFVTIGPLGLLSYLGILVCSAWRAVRRHMDNPYIMGAVFAVACYSIQSMVNINQPIATPLMWVLLCISAAEPGDPWKCPWKIQRKPQPRRSNSPGGKGKP